MTVPVYLYTGPENGEKNDAIAKIKTSLKKKFGETEEYLFYASESPAGEYMSVLQNESLFASATCVVVKAAESIKNREEIETITDWIKNCTTESSVLILVSDENSIDSKLEKNIPASNKKIFWEMFDNRKVPWLKDFFSKNGYRITESAAELILDMIENNTETMKNECSRFFVCFPRDHEITEADVDSILTHTREENAFSLFDAMTDNSLELQARFEKSLEILQKIRFSKQNSSVLIVAGLTSCFRKIILWEKLHDAGTADDFNLKINGFSGMKIKNQYSRAARIWTWGQATAILAILAGTDMQIRSGSKLLEDTLLQKMLYEIIIKKGASCASYETEL